MTTTPEQCIDALLEAAERLGKSPTKAEYEELGLRPASATIIRAMGSWNDAKEAADIEANPSSGIHVGPKPSNVSIPDRVSWEDMTVDQRWHYRNVSLNTQRTLDRRAELRVWVYEYKRDSGGCSRCDENDPACLEFHHLDAEEKAMSISALIQYEPSKERLLSEIAKCELMCANCHRKEHYEVPDGVA